MARYDWVLCAKVLEKKSTLSKNCYRAQAYGCLPFGLITQPEMFHPLLCMGKTKGGGADK